MPPPPPPRAPATAGLARQLYAEGLPIGEIVRRTGLSRTQVYYWADRMVAPDGAVSPAPLPRRRPIIPVHSGDGTDDGDVSASADGGGVARKRSSSAGKPSRAKRPAISKCDKATAPRPKASTPRPGHDEPQAATAGAASRRKVSAASQPARRAAGGSPRSRLLARLWRAAERQVAEIEARIAAAGLVAGAGEPRAAADMEKDARALALLARTLRELSAAEGEGAPVKGKAASEDDTVRDLDVFRRELARRLDRLREGGPGAGPAG